LDFLTLFRMGSALPYLGMDSLLTPSMGLCDFTQYSEQTCRCFSYLISFCFFSIPTLLTQTFFSRTAVSCCSSMSCMGSYRGLHFTNLSWKSAGGSTLRFSWANGYCCVFRVTWCYLRCGVGRTSFKWSFGKSKTTNKFIILSFYLIPPYI